VLSSHSKQPIEHAVHYGATFEYVPSLQTQNASSSITFFSLSSVASHKIQSPAPVPSQVLHVLSQQILCNTFYTSSLCFLIYSVVYLDNHSIYVFKWSIFFSICLHRSSPDNLELYPLVDLINDIKKAFEKVKI